MNLNNFKNNYYKNKNLKDYKNTNLKDYINLDNHEFNNINNKVTTNKASFYYFKNIKTGKLHYPINPLTTKLTGDDEQLINEYLQSEDFTTHTRLRGGIIDQILKPIVDPVVGIGNVFILMLKTALWLIKFTLWFLRLAIWFIITFIPLLFGNMGQMVKFIIVTMITAPFDFIKLLIKHIFGNGIIEQRKDLSNKCYTVDNDGSVPTTVLIATLLCPPLGIFMVYGLTGWLSILISAILSLVYYFPGMIFALIKIYTDMDL